MKRLTAILGTLLVAGLPFFCRADSWSPGGAGVGNISGDVGATDNAVLRANGVGGTTIQGGAIEYDDTGRIAIPQISVDAPSELTIATGGVTITNTWHTVKAETSTTDDLDTISGGATGDVLFLQNKATHTITIRHGVDNIVLPSGVDYPIPADGYVMLLKTATNWIAVLTPVPGTAGAGDVIGPASSVDNQLFRYHLTTGKIAQAAWVYAEDDGDLLLLSTADYLRGTDYATLADTTQPGKIGDNALVRWNGILGRLQQWSAIYSEDTGVTTFGIQGADGGVKIYSEQGATDYVVGIHPNAAMTHNTDIYLPADAPTGEAWLTMGTDTTIDYTLITSAGIAAAVPDENGTGALTFSNTATLTDVALGTPLSGVLTNCTGLPVSTGVSGLAADVATFLATPTSANLAAAVTDENGSGALTYSNAATLTDVALGTPLSGVLTNATGLPISTGLTGLGADMATFLATPTSANLATTVTDENGSGALTYSNAATLTDVALGTPLSGVLTNATGLPISTGLTGLGADMATFLATPTSANLATTVTDENGSGALTFSNTATLTDVALGTPLSGILTNTTGLPISTGVSGLAANMATWLGTSTSANLALAVTDENGSGALTFSNAATLTDVALGTPLSGVLTNLTGLPITTGVSGLAANVATFLATPSSANAATAVTDETGSGLLVFNDSPLLILQDGAGGAPTTDGQIKWNRTTERMQIGDGAATLYPADKIKSFTFTIESPVASSDYPIWTASTGFTITGISAICRGPAGPGTGGSVVGALDEYAPNGTTLTAAVDGDWTITSTLYGDTSFTNAALAAGSWLSWHTSSVTTPVTSLSVTWYGYKQ